MLAAANHTTHVLTVRNVLAGSSPAELLKTGDLLLAVDRLCVTDFADVDRAVEDNERVEATVLRDCKELTLHVPVARLSCAGTSRIVLFAGLFLQEPHPAVLFHGFAPKEIKGHGGVYCSSLMSGSPAQRFELKTVQFVLAIDDVDTPDLDTVVKVVARIKDGQSVRIKMISLAERSKVYGLKVDYQYFPSTDLARDPVSLTWKLSLITPLHEERSNL